MACCSAAAKKTCLTDVPFDPVVIERQLRVLNVEGMSPFHLLFLRDDYSSEIADVMLLRLNGNLDVMYPSRLKGSPVGGYCKILVTSLYKHHMQTIGLAFLQLWEANGGVPRADLQEAVKAMFQSRKKNFDSLVMDQLLKMGGMEILPNVGGLMFEILQNQHVVGINDCFVDPGGKHDGNWTMKILYLMKCGLDPLSVVDDRGNTLKGSRRVPSIMAEWIETVYTTTWTIENHALFGATFAKQIFKYVVCLEKYLHREGVLLVNSNSFEKILSHFRLWEFPEGACGVFDQLVASKVAAAVDAKRARRC